MNFKKEQLTDFQFRRDWIRLCRTTNVGPITFWDLLRMYHSPSVALEQLPSLAKWGGAKREIIIPSKGDIEEEIKAAEQFGAQIITAFDEVFPSNLKELPDCPPVLTVKGNLNLFKQKKYVAIIGSRNASANGCNFARDIANNLGKNSYIIVSGLAKGIDHFAHQGSIDTGTIGVIAGGINNIYPQENTKLYHILYDRGVVVSEFPFNTSPISKHFPQRNRIISGLSLGILVIEAALRSGTLITARFALEQGREVFAVPGSPLDIRCQGTNSLIKQGAHLLETYQDVIEVLEMRNLYYQDSLFSKSSEFISPAPSSLQLSESEINKWRKAIEEKLSYTPCSIEILMQQTKIPLIVLSRILVEMGLAGKIERLYGNKIALLHYQS